MLQPTLKTPRLALAVSHVCTMHGPENASRNCFILAFFIFAENARLFARQIFIPSRSMALTWSPAVRWTHNSQNINRIPHHVFIRNFGYTSVKAQRRLADLHDKVSLRTGPLGRLSRVINPRESSKITTRVGSSFGGNHSLEWCEMPQNVLLIKKIHDEKASTALSKAIEHIKTRYPAMNIIVEQSTYKQFANKHQDLVCADISEKRLLASKVDLAVTLGGDGTILHVSSLFDQDAVPPVLSFSMGTLGFLLPYRECACLLAHQSLTSLLILLQFLCRH